ncbi:MAG: SPOR domain-containing protein [Ketobacteraceae bacterium]|nr:SPOR domain-containing protein [Ketobacteraceae bacterium]
MRWIFLSLVLFNLLYFGWEFYVVPNHLEPAESRADSAVRPTAAEPEGGERLVLLKEVLTTAGQSVPPPSINRLSRERQVQKAASQTPESPKAPPRVAGEPATSPESAASGAEDPAPAPVCAKVGPFEDEARAQALLMSLEEMGADPVLRQDEVVLDVDNWVVIPPLGSRSEALRILRRLQSNKVDSYLISEGEFANGISLGLFKQPASAQGVLARMASAGYEAEIHQIKRTESRFWVGLTGGFEPGSTAQMLTQLVDDSEKIKFSETLCEMFASTP